MRFNNPFRYRQGLYGMVKTMMTRFLCMIDDLVSIVSFTAISTSFSLDFIIWIELREVEARAKEQL